MDIHLLFILLLIVAPIGTILHEIGHAVGAKLVKADQITLSIGLGKEVGRFSIKNFTVIVHVILFIGGYLHNQRKTPYKLLEVITITLLGPVSNGVFAFLFYYLYTLNPNDLIKMLFLFNSWLAIVNIIPFKIGTKQSDGYTILNGILQKRHIR